MFKSIQNVLRKASKIILVVAIIFTVINVFYRAMRNDSSRAMRPQPTEASTKDEVYAILHDPKYISTPGNKLILEAYGSFVCSVMGQGCVPDLKDGLVHFNNSLLGKAANIGIMPLEHPPASGVEWAYTGLQNAGFVPKTYAASGIGFSAIAPFRDLWKVFRDMSYMVLVVLMIVIGFMIMFRAKISAQTVISVENALPRIVLSLLLITFSYAIAGFLIDMMYVISAVIISVMSGPGSKFYDPAKFADNYLNGGISTIEASLTPASSAPGFWSTMLNAITGIPVNNSPSGSTWGISTLLYLSTSLLQLLPGFMRGFLNMVGGLGAWIGAATLIQKFKPGIDILNNIGGLTFNIGNIPGSVAWFAIVVVVSAIVGSFLVPLLISFMIFLTSLYITLRIFIMLLLTYVRILLLIMFAPLYMLADAIPGQKAFGYWMKTLIGELLTFPLVIAIFLLGYIIINNFKSTGTGGTSAILWTPPFLATHGVDQYAFIFIVGMALLYMTPELVKMAKDLIGVKQSSTGGFGLGTFLGGGALAFSAFTGGLGGLKSVVGMMPTALQNKLGNKASGGMGLIGKGSFLGEQFGVLTKSDTKKETAEMIEKIKTGNQPGNP
ncbi:MAG: hypothetical protein RI947_259 [Candidatus Parcubacteria bacterium]|jgi:hypothetical protein